MTRHTREVCKVLMLDVKSCLIACETVSIGTLTSSLIHPREIFYPAIRHKASSIILTHNHPSGDATPSAEDVQVTRLIINAGSLLDIPVQDHLIVGSTGFVSMRQDYCGLWKRGERALPS